MESGPPVPYGRKNSSLSLPLHPSEFVERNKPRCRSRRMRLPWQSRRWRTGWNCSTSASWGHGHAPNATKFSEEAASGEWQPAHAHISPLLESGRSLSGHFQVASDQKSGEKRGFTQSLKNALCLSLTIFRSLFSGWSVIVTISASIDDTRTETSV